MVGKEKVSGMISSLPHSILDGVVKVPRLSSSSYGESLALLMEDKARKAGKAMKGCEW